MGEYLDPGCTEFVETGLGIELLKGLCVVGDADCGD